MNIIPVTILKLLLTEVKTATTFWANINAVGPRDIYNFLGISDIRQPLPTGRSYEALMYKSSDIKEPRYKVVILAAPIIISLGPTVQACPHGCSLLLGFLCCGALFHPIIH